MRIVLATFAFVLSGSAAATADPTYEDVQPILATHCVRCHGDGGRAKGLDLQHFPFTSVLREDATAADLVALSIQRIRATTYPMPPGGGVPEDEVAVVEAWLAAGLPAADP